jgi:CDP-diacylglycerol---serine O-phosphatidyltransferase
LSTGRWRYYLPLVDFRKSLYVLPNLFTLAGVLCGFMSLALSASGRGDADFYLAALAICFGFVFDTVDGRVARLTRTQTELGRDLDSLADVITFGAAPALLVYKWGLTSFGRLGIFVAGLFLCAGCLRLARFNVLSRREEAAAAARGPSGAAEPKRPGKYTVGLSIPPAASVLVFMVIVSHTTSGLGPIRLLSEGSTAVIVVVLSLLMVSRVRFRSFKDLRLSGRTIGVALLLVGAGAAVILAGFEKAAVLLLLVIAYIGLGLAEEVIFFRSRRAEARAAKLERQAAPPQEQEEEVLRELGAYDQVEDEPSVRPLDQGQAAARPVK